MKNWKRRTRYAQFFAAESPQWWLNRLRRIHARWREHLMIAAGYVQKKSSHTVAPVPYGMAGQKKANREYLKAMELEDRDTGRRISLIDKVAGSVANPANRRRELMTRMRGFEDLAKLEGLPVTLHADSTFRYHSMQHNGRRNNKYCGASPRRRAISLQSLGKNPRSVEEKRIRVFGFRWSNRTTMQRHWHFTSFYAPRMRRTGARNLP